MLNIVVQPGDALDVRGEETTPTVNLSPGAAELDRLRAEVAALRERLAALEAKAAGK